MSQDASVIDTETRDYIEIWKKAKIPPERHLGLLEGNHTFHQTSFGINPIAYFCSELKYPHLAEYSAIIPLLFKVRNSDACIYCIIKAHHGFGGGSSRMEGNNHNKFIADSKNYDNWNISLYGHVHGLWADPIVILDCKTKTNNVDERIGIVACCGTFLKTLEKGKTAPYSERFGMPPRVISWQEIEIGFKTKAHKSEIHLRFPRQVPSM